MLSDSSESKVLPSDSGSVLEDAYCDSDDDFVSGKDSLHNVKFGPQTPLISQLKPCDMGNMSISPVSKLRPLFTDNVNVEQVSTSQLAQSKSKSPFTTSPPADASPVTQTIFSQMTGIISAKTFPKNVSSNSSIDKNSPMPFARRFSMTDSTIQSAADPQPILISSESGQSLGLFHHLTPVHSSASPGGGSNLRSDPFDRAISSCTLATAADQQAILVSAHPRDAAESDNQAITRMLSNNSTDWTVFLINLARALHSYGCPTHRTEILCGRAAFTRGVNCQVAVFPSLIIMSFHGASDNPAESRSYNFKLSSGLDGGKLQDVDDLARQFAESDMDIIEATQKLSFIVNSPPNYPLWLQLLAFILSSFSATLVFFGGSWIDAGVAAGLGLMVGVVLTIPIFTKIIDRATPLALALVASCVSYIIADLIGRDRTCPEAVCLAGIIWMLPGLSITSSVAEIAAKSYVSGTANFFYSILTALQLGFGMSIGARVVQLWSNERQKIGAACPVTFSPREITPLLLIICLASFAVMLNTKPRTVAPAVFCGCTGYTVFFLISYFKIFTFESATVLASFSVGLMSEIIGRLTHHQPFVLVLNGILVLLPGGISVRGAASLFLADSSNAMNFGSVMVITGFSVTMGLIIARTAFPSSLWNFAETIRLKMIQREENQSRNSDHRDSEGNEDMESGFLPSSIGNSSSSNVSSNNNGSRKDKHRKKTLTNIPSDTLL